MGTRVRKSFAIAAGAAALSLALAGCSAPGSQETPSADAGEDLVIALIPPTSGPFAVFGDDIVHAWQLAADQANADGGVDGREVRIVVRGTDATAATTLREANAAVTEDGANFIGAVMTSPEHAAINAQLESLDALLFNASATDDALIGESCSPLSFTTIPTVNATINTLIGTLEDLPGTKYAIQAADYSTGHAAVDAFTAAAEDAGKEVVLAQYAPLGTTDFGPYITAIQNSGADAVFGVEFGADGVAFVKQSIQFGLVDQLDAVVGINMVSEPLFPALGPGIEGFYNNVNNNPGLDNDLNNRFQEEYEAAYGIKPYFLPSDNYIAAEILFAGVAAAGTIDPETVAETLRGMTIDTIIGEVTVRADDNQVIRPQYVGQVVADSTTSSGLAFDIIASQEGKDIMPEPNPACSF